MSSVLTPAGTRALAVSTPPSCHDVPDWLASCQQKAWDDFLRLPLPTTKDENWRYGSPKQLDLTGFNDGFSLPEPPVDPDEALPPESAATFHFGNGILLSTDPLNDHPDVVCLPFLEAAAQYPEKIRALVERPRQSLGSDKYAALQAARSRGGLVLVVPDNTVIEQPINIVHWVGGENAVVFPRTIIAAGANSDVTVIEQYRSADSHATWTVGGIEIVAGTGSKVHYALNQQLNLRSKALILSAVEAGRDAHITSLQAHLGSAWTRAELVGRLAESGGHSDLISVSLPHGETVVDQRTRQFHEKPNTTSDLLYKNALFDRAESVFAGLIQVAEGAHQTDAYQTCRNLLLSDTVTAHAMPGLEINADQVKCSHGSTSGQIGDDEIFYFAARGIPADAARKLITSGFIAEAVSKFDKKVCADWLMAKVDKRLD